MIMLNYLDTYSAHDSHAELTEGSTTNIGVKVSDCCTYGMLLKAKPSHCEDTALLYFDNKT